MLFTPLRRPRVGRARAASTLVVALVLALVPSPGVPAQDPPPAREDAPIQGIRWSGGAGITETVAAILARQEARSRLAGPPHILEKPELGLPEKTQADPGSLAVSRWPFEPTLAVRAPEPRLPQPVGVNFLGITGSVLGAADSAAVPPDSMGGVGPTQVVVASNGRLRVFDKSGGLGPLNVADDVFWDSVRNGEFVTDPRVRYDRLSGRWFLTIINVPTDGLGNPLGPNRILIAVSSGPTITNTSSFTFFGFQQDVPPPAGDLNGFADYDTLGVDRFAVYIGANMFSQDTSTFLGSSAWVINKADLLAGTLTVTAFRQLATGTGAGCTTPQGATNDDPAATEGYFIGVDGLVSGRLVLRRVSNPGGTPSISGNLNLTVPATRAPVDVPAQGAGLLPLDGLDDRLFVAHVRRNKLTGATSLWTAHNIEVDATGVAAAGGRNGSRWYEVENLTGTPTLRQAGTLFDGAVANPRSYWIPSANMSGQGHVALGASFAGANDLVGVAVAGRLAGDPLGSTAAPTIAQPGLFEYDDLISGFLGLTDQRWGDYSQTVVDPNDDMTFWTFQEYSAIFDFGGWGVRATQLRAPPPATPAAANPATVAPGQAAVSVTVTGTSTSGSGFFDPGPDTGGPGFANRIGASVSGGVTVNSVTFTSPTQVTLSLDTTAATAGLKTVTITNPDGQSANGAILTISGVTPTGAVLSGTKTVTGSFVPGGAISYTIVLTNTGTGAQADNPGNELADVLPASLTLVSANASSGTATATVATNTVTWNGALAVSGTVTITIQATIGGTVAGGTVVSNQGAISYDSDGNATNDASAQTDDPAVGGASDPTVFTVSSVTPTGAVLSGTKTVTGSLVPGGAITYTIVLTNTGTGAQANNAGNELTDVLPATLTLVSANATGGSATATVATNTVTWNGALAVSGNVTITIQATIKGTVAGGTVVSNQGAISYDSDGNGTNDASAQTDDPAVVGAANPTVFTVSGVTPTGPVLSGTKTVTGTFLPGGAITYTIVLSNTGTGAQANNAGNELTDVLPATLTLVSANATGGTATATVATNTVTWNGGLAVSGTVTITIQATVKPTVTGGTSVSNQGAISYDSDGNGTNDASAQTDDPAVAGASNPTVFTVRGAFFTVTPCRIVDTRTTPNGPLAGPALMAGASRSFTLAGACGVPATAKAVSLNVTVTQATGAGNLRLYPAGQAAPLVSTINWVAAQTRANNAVATLSSAGLLAVQCDQASGTVHLILDVNGYFQ